MGRRGPKPEPAAVKEAKGNPSRRPIGRDPEPDVGQAVSVTPPSWMKADAKRVWQRLAPRLAAMKLLSATDSETFARYCTNFARWLKMQKRLDKMGEVYEIETASGVVRRMDPAFSIASRLERELQSIEAVFGLNPAERQRIMVARAGGVAPDPDGLFGNKTDNADKRDEKQPKIAPPVTSAAPKTRGFLQ